MRNPLHQLYMERWSGTVQELARQRIPGSKITAFLHPAKTGGTTIEHTIRNSERWSFIKMRPSCYPDYQCSCGDPEYTIASRLELGKTGQNPAAAETRYFLRFGHERYDGIRWFAKSLNDHGMKMDAVYMTYRPAHDRLVSLFCDYWNQALSYNSEFDPLNSEGGSLTEFYKKDSEYYLDEKRHINGRDWFRSFMANGSGFPFSMEDIFDGSVMNFRYALAEGEIHLTKTGNIDSFLSMLTGSEKIERKRVSNKNRPESVVAALSDARDIIDELVERDWAYDQVADEYFTIMESGQKFKV
jgi:hypothetical protein